jgi:hypothetical protein
MNMKIRKFVYVLLSSALVGLIVGSCNHFAAPTSVWDPSQQYGIGPVISSVLPSPTAIAGVKEITIIGRNFAGHIDSNWVWYDADSIGAAGIKSYSLSGATDTIVIFRPANFGTNLLLKVVVPAADSTAKYAYTMEQPVVSTPLTTISGTSFVMTTGGGNTTGDTVWIATTGYVYQLLPGSVAPSRIMDTSYLKQKVLNPTTGKMVNSDFVKPFMDMKVGPGHVLYATFKDVAGDTVIYRLDPDSSLPVKYATFSDKKTAGYIDFDDNGNLYTGNSLGLWLVKPDGSTSQATTDYNSLTIVALRVVNKYVYVASSSGIFRSPINSNGTVGSQETVCSITSDTSLAGASITSFDVASDGTVFVSLSGKPNYSFFELQNGALLPYYRDASIVPTGIVQVTWGAGRWLYLNTGSTTLYSMGIAKDDGTARDGAPYLGRGL